MPGDLWLIGACICHRIRQPLQDRLGGSLEGSSGLLFRSQMLTNNCRRACGGASHDELNRRRSLFSFDLRRLGSDEVSEATCQSSSG
jgi:hypothetical protein